MLLGDEASALVTVAMVSVWKNMGYYAVLYISAILNIPNSYYEAASPSNIEQSIPKNAKNFSIASTLPFKIAFQMVHTTALDDNTGIKMTTLAIFPSHVFFLDAIKTAVPIARIV